MYKQVGFSDNVTTQTLLPKPSNNNICVEIVNSSKLAYSRPILSILDSTALTCGANVAIHETNSGNLS